MLLPAVSSCMSRDCLGVLLSWFDADLPAYAAPQVDISKDNRALQKLRRETERAKRALSSQHQVLLLSRADNTMRREKLPVCSALPGFAVSAWVTQLHAVAVIWPDGRRIELWSQAPGGGEPLAGFSCLRLPAAGSSTWLVRSAFVIAALVLSTGARGGGVSGGRCRPVGAADTRPF